jgi:hypothetical protein
MRVVQIHASPSHPEVPRERERQAPRCLDADLLRAAWPHVENPIHERIYVQALQSERLLMFENNDPAVVRDLAVDRALARKAAYQLDWSGTWELDTGMPFCELRREDPAPLKVIIRFELPVPIRVEKLLTTGFGLSRTAVRGMVDSGRIRLPMAIDAKAREDFTLCVIAIPPPSRHTAADQQAPPGPGGDGSHRAPAGGASLHVAARPESCSRWSRIGSSGTPDSRSPSAAVDL